MFLIKRFLIPVLFVGVMVLSVFASEIENYGLDMPISNTTVHLSVDNETCEYSVRNLSKSNMLFPFSSETTFGRKVPRFVFVQLRVDAVLLDPKIYGLPDLMVWNQYIEPQSVNMIKFVSDEEKFTIKAGESLTGSFRVEDIVQPYLKFLAVKYPEYNLKVEAEKDNHIEVNILVRTPSEDVSTGWFDYFYVDNEKSTGSD